MAKPAEHGIDANTSDFLIHTPSAIARTTFFYPLRVGKFSYEPGYRLERRSFDSYLIIHIDSGRLTLNLPEGSFVAEEGRFALVNCYARHAYGTDVPTTAQWLHFDGVMARPYYDYIIRKLGNVFMLSSETYALEQMRTITSLMTSENGYSEARMSKYITDLLTEFADEQPRSFKRKQEEVVEDTIAYVSSHLYEPLTVSELAKRVFLSEYHFIRLFKQETGITPHAYLVDSRIHAVQYLLVNTGMSIRQICQQCGFTSKSSLCASFKKSTGMTPMKYRRLKQGE